jgi:hypothetical protein
MRSRMTFVSLCVCLAVGIPSARAGAPTGPSLPIIEKGQWAVGIEYAYEKIDVEADGRCVESIAGGPSESYRQEFTIDSMKTNMLFGRIEYALCRDWDVFVRLGASDADADIEASGPGVILGGRGGEVGLDGSFGFGAGVGTRATLCQSGPWRIDGLAQVTWLHPDDSDFAITNVETPDESVTGTAKLDYLQGQIGLTAVYRADAWSLWAGPFLQIIDGDLDMDAQFIIDGVTQGRISCSGDVEEDSQFGLTLGANCEVTENFIAWVEGQFTGDSWLVGIGGMIRPDKLLGEW